MYRNTKEFGNADGLLRLPLKTHDDGSPTQDPDAVFLQFSCWERSISDADSSWLDYVTGVRLSKSRPCTSEATWHYLSPWDWPTSLWERLHADFAGPFKSHMYFILVGAHSKWPDVVQMTSTTSNHTINVLRSIFARYGLPKQPVTDDGPQFVLGEFKVFLKGNGIRHITSSP